MNKETWIICNAKKKSNHCRTQCPCGKPHIKQPERDECHNNYEMCGLGGKIQRVICVPVKEKK